MRCPDRFGAGWWRLLLFGVSVVVSFAATVVALVRHEPWQLWLLASSVYGAMINLAWNETKKWF